MKTRYRLLGFLFTLAIITYIDRICIAVAGPRMQADLGLTPDQWGWVLGAFALAYATFEVPIGAMGDRIGPRRVLTRITTWWSAFTVLTGMVSNFYVLVVIRFLFGAGEAGAFPNATSSMGRWIPAHERARAQGLFFLATRVGGALTPLVVIPLQIAFGWRASFFVFGILGVAWAIAWYRWYRDDPAAHPAMTAAELGEIGCDTAASKHGMPWRRALHSRTFWSILAMYFTYCYGASFFFSWLHTYLAKGRGWTETGLLWSTLPFVFAGIGSISGGWAGDFMVARLGLKWGRRSLGVLGLALSCALTLCVFFTANPIVALLLLSLSYAASDFMLPSAWAVCLDVGRKHGGALTGAMNTAGQVGSFISSIVFGYVVRHTGSYEWPLIPIAVMLAVSALLWFAIDPTEQVAPEEEASVQEKVVPGVRAAMKTGEEHS